MTFKTTLMIKHIKIPWIRDFQPIDGFDIDDVG